MRKCMCEKNWMELIKKYEPFFGDWYQNEGDFYRFKGIMNGVDDYYFCMASGGETRFLSCVLDLRTYGFFLVPKGDKITVKV